MIIIFGGAYQGKLEYAIETYGIREDDIFDCKCIAEAASAEDIQIDFSKKVIYHLEQFVLACNRVGLEAKEYLKEHIEEIEDKIIIGEDISQGLVPMEREMRDWREMQGRTMIYLCGKADKVTRVFCGLPQDIKDIKGRKHQESYIHFIRHGMTEGNVKRWYYGRLDIPLLDEGKEQLRALSEQGIYPVTPRADYYTSGLIRTIQTMEEIFGEREYEVIDEFKEMMFGDFEGKTYEELKHLDEYQAWISEKEGNVRTPNGESRMEFFNRVMVGFDKVKKLHRMKEFSLRHEGADAHSVVVCHGGVISALMMGLFEGERRHFYEWIPDPGHGYTLKIEDGVPVSYTVF